MFTKKGEATLTVLILGVLAVSLISAFSNSYTGYQTADPRSCTDTDGNDTFTFGSIFGTGLNYHNKYYNYSLTDNCEGFIKLRERICINNGLDPSANIFTCPNGCVNDACLPPTPTRFCTDTDNGNNTNIQGTTYGVGWNARNSNFFYYNYTDHCNANSNVIERSCVNDSLDVNTYSYECPNGCQTGVGVCLSAPVTPTCTMSVDSTTVIKGGNTTLRWNTTYAYTFFINGETGSTYGKRVINQINQTTTYLGEARGRGGTSTCQTTITVTQQLPTCTDTDPNNDVYVKGEVRASGVGYGYLLADVCSGSNKVKERYCGADKKPKDLIKDCPNNKKCIQAKGICQK